MSAKRATVTYNHQHHGHRCRN